MTSDIKGAMMMPQKGGVLNKGHHKMIVGAAGLLVCLLHCVTPRPLYARGLDFSGQGAVIVHTGPHLSQETPASGPEGEWPLTYGRVFLTVAFFIITLFIIKYLTRFLERMAEGSTSLRLTIKRLIPLIPMIGWTAVIYLLLTGVYALPIQSIIAIAATAGIALGFASQDILKNIFGGIMILIDRPFQVGDKIEVGSYYGEVVQLGLRSVRIVTPDDNLVSIPNGDVMNQSIANANAGESNAQVVSEFFLPPDIDLIQAKRIAYRAAAVSRYIYLNKPIAVIIKNEVHQGRSLLKMRLKAYVLDIRFESAFASEMTEIVIQEFLRAGLIAVEQLTLVKSSSSSSRLWPF
jgi:MscS family membrane protein